MTPSLIAFDTKVKLPLTRQFRRHYGSAMATKTASQTPMDPTRLGIAQRLKTCRMAKGLTQQQVADKLSVKKATVSAWETGAGAPDAMRLRSLARIYDVSADAILWDDSMSPEAMKFAAQYDALTDKQRRTFQVMWMAYFEEALSDDGVEAQMPITKERRTASEFPAHQAHQVPLRRKTDHK
jgi:transcriptional regulator with XRE-family HTH domain